MPQITIGPNAEAGVYVGTLQKVSDPYEKEWNDGTKSMQLDWSWVLPNGEPVRESTSVATGPKSKLFMRMAALNGGKGPRIGEAVELNDYVGKRAILTIEINANGYPKIVNVGAIPAEMLQRDFAAATGAPVREPVAVPAGAAPVDDLDF